jgi:hypothetical protein
VSRAGASHDGAGGRDVSEHDGAYGRFTVVLADPTREAYERDARAVVEPHGWRLLLPPSFAEEERARGLGEMLEGLVPALERLSARGAVTPVRPWDS